MKKLLVLLTIPLLLMLSLAEVKAQTSDPGGGTGGGGSGTAGGTATASAPVLVEGSTVGNSYDLAGNLRTTMGTLLWCEDQTNLLCMVSGGKIRVTTFSSVTSATTSSVTTVPTGAKTFIAQIINGSSETKAITVTVFGNLINSTTGGIPLCTITLPSTATVLQLQDFCVLDKPTPNFQFYFYTVSTYTSASSAPFTLYAVY